MGLEALAVIAVPTSRLVPTFAGILETIFQGFVPACRVPTSCHHLFKRWERGGNARFSAPFTLFVPTFEQKGERIGRVVKYKSIVAVGTWERGNGAAA